MSLPSIVELVRSSEAPDAMADLIAEWIVKPDARKLQLVNEARELLAIYLLFLAEEPAHLNETEGALIPIIFEMPICEQIRLAMGGSKNPRIARGSAILLADGDSWPMKRKLYPELTRFLRDWR